MSQYRILSRREDGAGQRWDVLEGLTLGPCSPEDFEATVWADQWDRLSPFFSPQELACKGTSMVCVYLPALEAYNALRKAGALRAHSPNSAYRAPVHNRGVGGSAASRHLAGAAFDVPRTAFAWPEGELIEAAARAGFNGFGFYRSFVHFDFRASPARWTG